MLHHRHEIPWLSNHSAPLTIPLSFISSLIYSALPFPSIIRDLFFHPHPIVSLLSSSYLFVLFTTIHLSASTVSWKVYIYIYMSICVRGMLNILIQTHIFFCVYAHTYICLLSMMKVLSRSMGFYLFIPGNNINTYTLFTFLRPCITSPNSARHKSVYRIFIL
jgi:hypothetical protein